MADLHAVERRMEDRWKYSWILRIVNENTIWLILLLSFLVMAFASSTFFSKQNLLNLALNSSSLGILVIAEAMCLIIGKIDISIESNMAFSALIGALLVKNHVNPIIAMFSVLLIGSCIGLINGVFISVLGINTFMQTLAMNIILRGMMLVLTEGLTIFNFPKLYRMFGEPKVLTIPIPIIILIIAYAFFIILLQKRRWGRRLYAVGTNEIAAFVSGINIRRVNIEVFVIAGFLAAFAGLIESSRFNAVHNNLAKGQVFEVFAAAVMGGISLSGGKGRLSGAIGGVLFLGCITSILTWLRVNVYVVQTMRGLVILFAILLDAFKSRLQEKIELR